MHILSDLSNNNPFPNILQAIPESGLELTPTVVTHLSKLFALGGIMVDDIKETVYLLKLMGEWCGLVELIEIGRAHV